MANRMIFGTIMILALSLVSSLGNPGISAAMPLKKVALPSDGRFCPTPLSHPKSEPSLPPPIWEANQMPPLAAPRYNRFEAAKLPDRLLEQARRYLNTPYHRGGSLQTGRATDCSGFVQYIYRKANIDLPRASAEQAQAGKVAALHMDFSKLLAGDLLFFRNGGRHIGHVGIYLGAGCMIHAASHGHGVTVSDLHNPYYHDNFVVAKRLLKE